MESSKFYLLMKDHWNASDFAEYDGRESDEDERFVLKRTPRVMPEQASYEIGDRVTDIYGRKWKKVDLNLWYRAY